MSKHTPGPWDSYGIAGHGTHGQRGIFSAYNGGTEARDVAIVFDGDANAPLIAAAPELLEALKALLAHANAYSDEMRERGYGSLELGENADSVSLAGMARAAIAKAEGR